MTIRRGVPLLVVLILSVFAGATGITQQGP